MASERHEAIIDVRYLGTGEISTYIRDLQRLGIVSEQTALRLRNAGAGLRGENLNEWTSALGLASRNLDTYSKAVERAATNVTALKRSQAELLRSIADMDQAMHRFGKNDGVQRQIDAQRALMNLLRQNAVLRNAVEVNGNAPVAPGLPAIAQNFIQPAPRDIRSIEFARGAVDERRMVDAQRQLVESIGRRVRAMDSATAADNAWVRASQRAMGSFRGGGVGQIGDRQEMMRLGFAPGGLAANPDVPNVGQILPPDRAITTMLAGVQVFSQRWLELQRALDTAERDFQPTARQLNQVAFDHNYDRLHRVYTYENGEAQAANGTGSYRTAGELQTILQAVMQQGSTQQEMVRLLMHQGVANSTLLRRISPEARDALLGSEEGPAAYGATTKIGVPIPGMIGRAGAEDMLREETFGQLAQEADRARNAMRMLAAEFSAIRGLPSGASVRIQAAQATLSTLLSQQADIAHPVLYHGSENGLPPVLSPMSEVNRVHGQMYGPGTYLTDAAHLAATYATNQTGEGHIDAITNPTALGKVFDLSRLIPPGFVQDMHDAAVAAYDHYNQLRADPAYGPVKTGVGLSGFPTEERHPAVQAAYDAQFMAQDLFSHLKMLLGGPDDWNGGHFPGDPTYIGTATAAPTASYQDLLEHTYGNQFLAKQIQAATGATAFRYQGGSFTGGEIHNAYVALQPQGLRTAPVGYVNNGDSWQPTEELARQAKQFAKQYLEQVQTTYQRALAEAQANLLSAQRGTLGIGTGPSAASRDIVNEQIQQDLRSFQRRDAIQTAMYGTTLPPGAYPQRLGTTLERIGGGIALGGNNQRAITAGPATYDVGTNEEMRRAYAEYLQALENAASALRESARVDRQRALQSRQANNAFFGPSGAPIAIGSGDPLYGARRAQAAYNALGMPPVGMVQGQYGPRPLLGEGAYGPTITPNRFGQMFGSTAPYYQGNIPIGPGMWNRTGGSLGPGALPPGGGGGGYGSPPPGGGFGGFHDGEDANARHAASVHWTEVLDEEINAMRGEQQDPLFALRAAANRAAKKLEDVTAKGDEVYGKGPDRFASEEARNAAYKQAAQQNATAQQRLKDAEDKAAQAAEDRAKAEEEAAAAARLSAGQQAMIHGALTESGAISPVEAAQLNLGLAKEQAAAAAKNVTAARNGTYTSQEEAAQAYARALQESTEAQRTVTLAAEQLRAAEAEAAGGMRQGVGSGGAGGLFGGGGGRYGGGFFSDFGAGFRGNENIPVAAQLGQTARFSVYYGGMYKALFLITGTLKNALQEGIAFQQGMTDLSIATSRPTSELNDMADQLATVAKNTGMATSQAVELGARAQGLYGTTGANLATQTAVGTMSATAVGRATFAIPGADPVQAQQNIAAITQALGYGASGQFRVADLDAYLTKKFGAPQGSTFEALAQSASVGKAAGFSDEQMFALASLLQSRTGATPTAVGGYMAQIFSRGGQGALTGVAQQYGINTSQNLEGQFGDLAKLYGRSDQQTQSQIAAAFGRGKVQNAVVAALQDWNEVIREAQKAKVNAAGTSETLYQDRLHNVGGQLALLQGSLKDFANALGQSGMLGIVGVAVLAFRQLVDSVTGVLRLYDDLTGNFTGLITSIGIAALALKQFGLMQMLGPLGTAFQTARAASLAENGVVTASSLEGGLLWGRRGMLVGEAATASSVVPGAAMAEKMGTAGMLAKGGTLAGVAAPATLEATSLAASTETAGAFAGIGAAGASLTALIAPAAIAVGGLLAIGAIRGSMQRIQDAENQTTAAIRGYDLTSQSTPAEIRNRADMLTNQALADRQATGWFHNLVTFGHASDMPNKMANQLDAEAKRLERLANNVENSTGVATNALSGVFQSLNGSDIDQGVQALTASGASAKDSLNALRDALYATADAANAAETVFNPHQFAQGEAGGITKDALVAAKGLGGYTAEIATKDTYGHSTYQDLPVTAADIQNRLATTLTPTKVQSGLEAAMKHFGIKSKSDIGPKQADEIAQYIANGVAEQTLAPWAGLGNTAAFQTKLGAAIEHAVKKRLFGDTKDAHQMASRNGALSDTNATHLADTLVSQSDAYLQTLPTTAYGARGKELQQRIADLNHTNTRTGSGDLGHIDDLVTQAKTAYVQNELDQINTLRSVAIRNAKTQSAALRASRGYIRQGVQDIIKDGGNIDQLKTLLEQAGKGALEAARAMIQHALDVVNTALKQDQQLISMAAELGHGPGGGIGQVTGGADTSKHDAALQQQQKRLQGYLHSLRNVTSSTVQQETSGYGGTSGSTPPDTLEQINAARAAAAAAGTKSTLDDARTAVMVAQANVDAAKKHDAAYWGLVATLNSAKLAYAQALKAGPQNAQGESMADVNAAKAQALATRAGGGIAAAAATIKGARLQLSIVDKNTTEYWNAMGNLWSGMQALADAQLADMKNKMSLNVDMTNPLKMAEIDARVAAAKLRRDIAHNKSGDVIRQDRVDAQTAQANAESTAFSQRLQSVQTAEQLGRISFTKYMNYLQHEQDRLEAIKHRTFQQQQQLDQIDQLMKDASQQMAAQWNFGDIKLPTPYEVRRYIQQQAGGGSNGAMGLAATNVVNSSTTTINIDGADTAKVTQIIKDVVGKGARLSTTKTRKR